MKKILRNILLIILIAIIAVGVYAFSEINGKSEGEEVVVSVPMGSGTSTIADILEENEVIGNALVFKIYTRINPVEGLQYGDFTLRTDMGYEEVIVALQSIASVKETVSVTFPEGFTLVQMAQRLENVGLCTAEEFIETANNGDFSQFEFWNAINDNPHKFMKAEGYLFPSTYEFYTDETVYNIVARLFEEFDSRITDEMYAQMDAIGMSLDEVITLASFVQEEAGHPENQPYVAAVLRNRMTPNNVVMRLECNVCSDINEPGNYVYDYIVPYYGGVNNVPAGMMEAYDTYSITGLPPSPISNPGIDAIMNTLWPAEDFEEYYFFLTDLTGKYYYSKTVAEHDRNWQTALSVNAGLKND